MEFALFWRRKIGQCLLWLAHHHHSLELILAKLITLCFVLSSSSEILLYKIFKKVWHEILTDNFSKYLQSRLKLFLSKNQHLEILLIFVMRSKKIQRMPIKELLTETVIGQPSEKMHRQVAGPVHYIR